MDEIIRPLDTLRPIPSAPAGRASAVPAALSFQVGRRVLDSTPFYDALATMGTVTLIRAAIRVLGLADSAVQRLQAVL